MYKLAVCQAQTYGFSRQNLSLDIRSRSRLVQGATLARSCWYARQWVQA